MASMEDMNMSGGEIALPGFRFHPTEEELLDFYLKNMVVGKKLRYDVIGFLNIYHHDPWDLPGLAKVGEREWYFFVPRDKKHGSGGRPNRTTEKGFWKATGSDRKIVTLSDPKRIIGLKKTLVFYQGRAPRGCKTDWVMNEYRLPDNSKLPKEIVLCKIYRKATSLKVLEQRAALEEEREMKQLVGSPASPPSSTDTMSFNSPQEEQNMPDHHPSLQHVLKKEFEVETEEMVVPVSVSFGTSKLAVSSTLQVANALDVVDCILNCDSTSKLPSNSSKDSYLELPIVGSKDDRFSLIKNLPKAVDFAKRNLIARRKILLCCQNGEDISVCVALAIVALLFDDSGCFDNGIFFAKRDITKLEMRKKLVFICKFAVNARPSRGNLKQVYGFLCNEKEQLSCLT